MNQFSPLFTQDSSKKTLLEQNDLFSSLFNATSSTISSNKLIISPKKKEKSVRENFFPFPEPDLKDLCKKLDFSEASENTISNYSISDNENMEINEISSEDLNEAKINSDFSWMSSNSLKKIKAKKKQKIFGSEKNLTFIHKKKNLDDSLESNKSKFEEEYVIIKTLCKGEMGTVYLCLRLKDKKKFAVKKTKFFSRQFDYENIHNFVKDIELYSSQPGNEFIVKYIDFVKVIHHDGNHFAVAGRDVFAHIVRTDGEFPVPPVNQHCQLNGSGTAVVENRLNGSPYRTSCIDDVIHQDYFFTGNIAGDGSGAGLRQIADFRKVIPIQGDIDAAKGNVSSLKAADVIPEHGGKRHTAAVYPQQDDIACAVVFFNDFMGDALHTPENGCFIHDDRFQFHEF